MAPADFPFGFSGSNTGGSGGDDDLNAKTPLFAEIEKLMSWSGGPVNWDLARQVAIRTAAEGDRPVAASSAAVAEAVRLADLWLEDATTLPTGVTGDAQAWTRVRWVEATIPVWRSLIDPVAERVVGVIGETMQGGLSGIAENGIPPEIAGQLPPGLAEQLPTDPAAFGAMLGPMLGMLRQVGGMMFGGQVGQALGTLAGEVLTGAEIGLPLAPPGVAVLLPTSIASFGEGLEDIPADELRLYLALREAAGARLFAHVPWLRARLLGAVEEYARGIQIDPTKLTEGLGDLSGLDPSDPASLQRALGENLFEVAETPQQKAALLRLETLLALVEGWVDTVAHAAATGHLPAADRIRETVRRRRATGGPAEQTFAALVGLQLRPRRLRDAVELWSALAVHRGMEGRDALWAHPDLLPDGAALDDPFAFAAGGSAPAGEPGAGSDVAAADLADLDDPLAAIAELDRADAEAAADAGPADDLTGPDPLAPPTDDDAAAPDRDDPDGGPAGHEPPAPV